MKITVEYPQVMKMALSGTVEISESDTLEEAKEKILKSFWSMFKMKIYTPVIGIHGSKDNFFLRDKQGIIDSDVVFKQRLKTSSSFQAVFMTHE